MNSQNYSDEDDEVEDMLPTEIQASQAHEDSEGIWLMSYADMMTLLMGFFALLTSMADFDTDKMKAMGDSTAEFFGGEVDKSYGDLKSKIEKLIKESKLENVVKVTNSATELKINFEGTLFFQSGSTSIKSAAKSTLDKIVLILKKEAGDKNILVEGHTDDIPIDRGVIASNWELSSLRASQVARVFERVGFQRSKILTIGFGETRPLVPNRDKLSRPIRTNMSKNRRVVLKVMNRLPY